MIAAHKAVQAMLPPQVRGHLYTADLSDPPVASDYPYAVVWGDTGWDFSGDSPGEESLTDGLASREVRVRVTIAAIHPDSLSLALEGTRNALSGKRPTIPGWSCSRLEQFPLTDVQPDRDMSVGGANPIYLVDEYVFTVTRI